MKLARKRMSRPALFALVLAVLAMPACDTESPTGPNQGVQAKSITVPDTAPVAANFVCTASAAGLTVICTDTSTGGPTSWQWRFGDGNSSKKQNPVHEYAAAGSYVVTLTVSDSISTDQLAQFVTVNASSLVASFTGQKNGLTVIFTDTSAGGPESWKWRFGDGSGSSSQNPVHTYAAAGTYVASLEVRKGDVVSKASQFVTVP